MDIKMLFSLIIIPLAAGVLMLLLRKNLRGLKETIAILATAANFIIAILLFKSNISYSIPWDFFGIEFSLRLYHFSAFTILAAGFFGFLISIYSITFMRNKPFLNQFYAYFLLSLAFVNGAVLSNNLVFMLFFWEGLLITLFGWIAIGGKGAFKTATKTFIIVGIADLCMMIGIGITGHIAGTLEIAKISLPLSGLGSLAFVFLMIGAISKAGSMPFHSWIPDAAEDAPLPFMAFFPASIEKLLGIYFLTRICLDMFKLDPHSWISNMLMIIGALTILLAVMMALVQKNYKKLLSYHAISQVGYMILGIGTALPVGIIGGLFHMINNALYKSCLFLTSGAVEKQTGTTNLEKLGGLFSKMPVTFICFFITAVSISGVPPFNGFFSKELIYDAALSRGTIFYVAAVLGSFFTAASFLKLGHAAYLGKLNETNKNVKEAHWSMLIPMIVIAFTCVLFGVYNALPINKFLQPILGAGQAEGHTFSGMPANMMLVWITVLVLIGAILHHIIGVKVNGSGLKAVDHIHYAPFLGKAYEKAEKGQFDPYEIVLKLINLISKIVWWIDRKIDWVYDNFSVGFIGVFTKEIVKMHTGKYSTYIVWCILGMISVILFLLK